MPTYGGERRRRLPRQPVFDPRATAGALSPCLTLAAVPLPGLESAAGPCSGLRAERTTALGAGWLQAEAGAGGCDRAVHPGAVGPEPNDPTRMATAIVGP